MERLLIFLPQQPSYRGVPLGGGSGRKRQTRDQGYFPIKFSGKMPADLPRPALTEHIAAALPWPPSSPTHHWLLWLSFDL